MSFLNLQLSWHVPLASSCFPEYPNSLFGGGQARVCDFSNYLVWQNISSCSCVYFHVDFMAFYQNWACKLLSTILIIMSVDRFYVELLFLIIFFLIILRRPCCSLVGILPPVSLQSWWSRTRSHFWHHVLLRWHKASYSVFAFILELFVWAYTPAYSLLLYSASSVWSSSLGKQMPLDWC